MVLARKVAVITGAASGIGRAGARLFAREGARVVVADISSEGERVAEAIRLEGNDALFIQTDLRCVTDIEKMVRLAARTYGQIDIFWHNAGIAGPGGIERTTEENYEEVMGVHLKAAVFGAKFVIPEMQKLGSGAILFTSSTAGLKPSPFSLSYSVAKAGIIMLTRCLAVSLAKSNIRVNCICPAPVDTPMLDSIAERQGLSREELEKIQVGRVPIGRYVTLDEVTQAALFLVSDAASATTGLAFPVDGGMSVT